MGQTAESILVLLDQGSEEGLAPPQVERLTMWLDELDNVRLRRVTLFETRSATQMSELLEARRLRERVREALSPRAVIVDEAKVGQVASYLAQQGHILSQPPGPTSTESDD